MFDRKTIQKIALAGILAAVGVVGGTLSIPVGFTRCCPTQSVINVIAGVVLGPWYSVGMAFCVSLIRNMLGTGILASIMAYPIAKYLLGKACGLVTDFLPFMTVAVTGSIIAAVLVFILNKNGAMAAMRDISHMD